jgi:hypothetical protein
MGNWLIVTGKFSLDHPCLGRDGLRERGIPSEASIQYLKV